MSPLSLTMSEETESSVVARNFETAALRAEVVAFFLNFTTTAFGSNSALAVWWVAGKDGRYGPGWAAEPEELVRTTSPPATRAAGRPRRSQWAGRKDKGDPPKGLRVIVARSMSEVWSALPAGPDVKSCNRATTSRLSADVRRWTLRKVIDEVHVADPAG